MLKQRSLLFCIVVTFICLSQITADDDEDKESCVKTSKINYLSAYTNLYKHIRMCNRVAYSKSMTDSDGRIYLSYRGPLEKGEDPSKLISYFFNILSMNSQILDELCDCIRTYIMQGDWWHGAKNLCYVECDTVTLLLIGTPEKRFINAEPFYENPIDGIIDIFEIYSNTQVWEDNCLAKPGISRDGRKTVVWTCKYRGPNLPPKDVLCNYIYAYINGGTGKDILGDTATHSCSIKGDKFYLNLVAL